MVDQDSSQRDLTGVGGFLFMGLIGIVIASLVNLFLASSMSTTNELLRKSYSSPYLKQGAGLLQSFIDDPRLRKYFLQKEPAILTDHLSGKSGQKTEQKKTPEPQKPGQP